jgi:uncharacterized lipoprotein
MKVLLISVSLACLFVGCASEPTCDYDDEPYIAAASVPPLRAPEGLTAPDRSAALVIPTAPPGAQEKPSGKGRCLDRPPSYFQTAPNAPKTDSKDDKKDK